MDQMLDITRIKAGRLSLSPESILLGDVVQGMSTRSNRDKELAIQLHIPGNSGSRDRNGLHDIFINLLSNAFKFTSEEGPSPSGRHKRMALFLHEIRDTGSGSRGSSRQDLRGVLPGRKRKARGTGLGLAIAKRLVEEHGERSGWSLKSGRDRPSSLHSRLIRPWVPSADNPGGRAAREGPTGTSLHLRF